MGKMFFNNSSYDFFKRDEPIGYMEAIPKPKKVKVKTTKTPPPMAKAKERVVKNKDGTINQITIRRSSGEKVLHDAAIKIVELAAPYAKFPKNIENQVDILHILRTWQFINNKSFR